MIKINANMILSEQKRPLSKHGELSRAAISETHWMIKNSYIETRTPKIHKIKLDKRVCKTTQKKNESKSTDSLVWKFFLNHSDFLLKSSAFTLLDKLVWKPITAFSSSSARFLMKNINSILFCESERFTRERDECTSCKCICGTECFTAAGRAAKRKINRSTERQTVKVRQQEWTDARTNTHIPQWSTHQKQNPCHMQVWILLEIDTCMNLYGARCMAVFARRALGNKK